MSGDRPVVFEVEMLNASGKESRYRVRPNPPDRLVFEHWSVQREPMGTSPDAVRGDWREVQSEQTRFALASTGELAGLLPPGSIETFSFDATLNDRLASILFVAPLLAPCGHCTAWAPIEAERCQDCQEDPRIIVERCDSCDGSGDIDTGTPLASTCPTCGGDKVTETLTGKARWKYLRRCVDAGILTEEEAGAAFVEEIPS